MSYQGYNKQNMQESNPYFTPANITFVVINVVIFFVGEILTKCTGEAVMLNMGAMHPVLVLYGQWYRLITGTFLHSGISHLINNMLLMVCLGSWLERAIGKVKYIIFYFLAAIGSSLASMGWMLYSQDIAWSIGASGVVFAMMGAVLYMIIRTRENVRGNAIRRYLIMLALSLYFGFTTAGVDNAAHIGGAVFGFVLGIILFRKKKHGGQNII